MRLDLRDIIHIPGARKDFSFELDLSGFKFYGEHPLNRAIHVNGSVRNMAGALQLEGVADTVLDTRCDRCLKPITVPLHVPVETLLAEELANGEENDEIVLLDKGFADLDAIFSEACILALDCRHICSESCKGLCPTCGKDLNEGPCGCGKELDPRLAVLAKLLDKDSQDKDEEA